MTLPNPRFSPSRFFALAALLLAGCLSDGPNETGLSYAQHQGIQLSTPIYRLTFQNFPIDSVFSTELPLNHFGESLMVVGQDGPFFARMRMGFQITTQSERDSIIRGLSLKLVSLPPIPGGDSLIGYGFLQSSTAKHDSLTLLIESFAWNDTNGQFSDSLPIFHARTLATYNPFSTFNPAFIVKDTARIALAAAYRSGVRDSIQLCVLNNLRARMLQDTSDNWIVYVEASPLGSADSGMFRFVGNGGTPYNPGLILGKYQKYTPDTLATLLIPYTSGGLAGVNYQVTHTDGSNNNKTLLYGVSRGLNFRFNRTTLLDSIHARLGSKYPASAAGGKYDVSFYVPYGEIHFPLVDGSGNPDPRTRVNGPFALDMQLVSDVDSLDPRSDSGLVPLPLSTASLPDSLKLFPMQPAPPAFPGQAVDTLIATYRQLPSDTTLRQLILHWVINSTLQDTFLLTPDGNRQELALARYPGWLQTATLGVYPYESQAMVQVYFNLGGATEPNGFLVPGTTTQQTLYSALAQRFWRPGATELDVRATNSLGALLNRVNGSLPQMFLKPADHNAFDTAFYDTSAYNLVSYPVMGEIGFPLKTVTIDIYLYPLAAP
jgi:hypothetical protein